MGLFLLFCWFSWFIDLAVAVSGELVDQLLRAEQLGNANDGAAFPTFSTTFSPFHSFLSFLCEVTVLAMLTV